MKFSATWILREMFSLLGEFLTMKLAFFDRNIENNEQQTRAVSSIVQGGLSGIPYVIFGPPGTGKTVTISEAIKQIWRLKSDSHIVAAAPSNSAADLLAKKLIENIPKTQILR